MLVILDLPILPTRLLPAKGAILFAIEREKGCRLYRVPPVSHELWSDGSLYTLVHDYLHFRLWATVGLLTRGLFTVPLTWRVNDHKPHFPDPEPKLGENQSQW